MAGVDKKHLKEDAARFVAIKNLAGQIDSIITKLQADDAELKGKKRKRYNPRTKRVE